MMNLVLKKVISIAVGYQSLISEGEIGADQTRLSWFQRDEGGFAAFRMVGGRASQLDLILAQLLSLAYSLAHNSGFCLFA